MSPNKGPSGKKYLLVALLGAISGGIIVAFTTKAFPGMMSDMMSGMMQNMMGRMRQSGFSPGEM